jgi:N-acetylglucosamine-6-phosphate deacetylase
VDVDGGKVVAVEACNERTDVDLDLLVPGFVDLQVNGIDDVDVASAAGSDWDRLDQRLIAQGVTTWCPTLVTMPLRQYEGALGRIGEAMQRPVGGRPNIAGVHLEGPFLGGAPGAHPRELIIDVDMDWIEALPSHVAMVTIGAEQLRAGKAIAFLRDRGVLVSIGHTTATDDDLDRAVGRGARMVTHLFNGMSGLHHRSPGVAAWALTHPSVSASIIADGVHVHPRMLRLAFLNLGQDRAVLVTDSVAWRSGGIGSIGIEFTDGAPRLPDGTLAGSSLTMDAAVRSCVAADVPLQAALAAASTNPARLLGLDDRGGIEVGRRADMVALSVDLTVTAVWIDGRKC